MRGYIQDAIFSKYGIYTVLNYEESDRRAYMEFSANYTIYIAIMLKDGTQVRFFKLDKAVNLEDED